MDRYSTPLLDMDIRDIRYPFAVGPVRIELAVQQVFVFMYLLPQIDPFSAPPDLREQPVFLHDTQDSLGIAVDALLLQHQPHPAVAIGMKAALPLLRDDFRKSRVFLRPAQSMDKIIISASGYLKEAAHDGYWIFVSMPMDHCVFCSWPHFLSMERRKSRNSSFSIFSRLFSFS